MKIGFIINSLVSSKQKIESLFSSFESNDFSIEYFPTEYAGHAIELSQHLKEKKFDWIVSVGGDGTLNEIINGLIHEDESDVNIPNLAMFPVGTGNDYSLSIKTTRDPQELVKALAGNSAMRVDIGSVIDENNNKRYFINVADAGMGGEIAQKIATSGNVMGKWVYFKTILLSLFTFKRPTLHIKTAQKEIVTKVISVVIGKGISFGGGYKILFDAKLNDGKFFVAVIGDISILTYLIKIPKLLSGKRVDHPLVSYFHADKISIKNISEIDCYLEMDGEPSFSCPVEMECLASKINFLKLD